MFVFMLFLGIISAIAVICTILDRDDFWLGIFSTIFIICFVYGVLYVVVWNLPFVKQEYVLKDKYSIHSITQGSEVSGSRYSISEIKKYYYKINTDNGAIYKSANVSSTYIKSSENEYIEIYKGVYSNKIIEFIFGLPSYSKLESNIIYSNNIK